MHSTAALAVLAVAAAISSTPGVLVQAEAVPEITVTSEGTHIRPRKWRKLALTSTPSSADRSNKRRLRCAATVSDSFLQQMSLSSAQVAEIRKFESRNCELISFINEYYASQTSPAALTFSEKQEFHAVSDEEMDYYSKLYSGMIASYNAYKGAGL